MILAMLLFSLMNTSLRYASTEVATTQMVFLRNALAVLILLTWNLRPQATRPVLRDLFTTNHFTPTRTSSALIRTFSSKSSG